MYGCCFGVDEFCAGKTSGSGIPDILSVRLLPRVRIMPDFTSTGRAVAWYCDTTGRRWMIVILTWDDDTGLAMFARH